MIDSLYINRCLSTLLELKSLRCKCWSQCEHSVGVGNIHERNQSIINFIFSIRRQHHSLLFLAPSNLDSALMLFPMSPYTWGILGAREHFWVLCISSMFSYLNSRPGLLPIYYRTICVVEFHGSNTPSYSTYAHDPERSPRRLVVKVRGFYIVKSSYLLDSGCRMARICL